MVNAILISLLSGLAFFIGFVIYNFVNNKKMVITFSIGFSFSIIIGLCLFDLLPECLELMDNKFMIFMLSILGVMLLKVLDYFIPDHEHDSKNTHMYHIGLISACALILHNIIEGTAIYTTSLNDIKMGLFMSLGVSFHNIPLGLQISSMVNNKNKRFFMICLLALSSLFGVFFINVLDIVLTDYITGLLISVTLGMLVYISLFELFHEVIEHIKNKEMIYGLISGIIFVVIGVLFL